MNALLSRRLAWGILALQFAVLPTAVGASSILGVPGPGSSVPQVDAARSGMGGAGEAMLDRSSASLRNGARTAFNDKTSFAVSMSLDETALERDGAKDDQSQFLFDGISLSFPIGFLGNLSLVWWQLRQRDLEWALEENSYGSVTQKLSYKGAMYDLAPTWAFRVPKVPRLGLAATWRQTLGNEATYLDLPMSGTGELAEASDVTIEQNVLSSGGRPAFSAHWHGRQLEASGWAVAPGTLKRRAERRIGVEVGLGSVNYPVLAPSVDRPRDFTQIDESWEQQLPAEAGAAISWRLGRTQLVNLDFHQVAWDRHGEEWILREPFATPGSVEMQTSRQLAVGWARLGSSRGFDSFWQRMHLRAGAGWSWLEWQGATEALGAVGVGLPLGRRGTLLDLAFQAGVRQGEDLGGTALDETFLAARVTLNGIGTWGEPTRRRR